MRQGAFARDRDDAIVIDSSLERAGAPEQPTRSLSHAPKDRA